MLKRIRNFVSPPAIEQRAALLGGKNIPYILKRSSRRKSIALRIDDRGLTVSIPWRASEKWLQSVLQDKAHWVLKMLQNWQARKRVAIRWADGETTPCLGERLILRVVPGLFATPAYRRGNTLWVFIAVDEGAIQIEQAVSQWYRDEAERLFAERVAHYAALMDVAPRAVRLSSAKTQWGCCTAHGTVRLNKQLVTLPLHLVDYVVVHELAHLREMNHSAAFWDVVESVLPDYLKLRRELKTVSL